MERRTEIMNIIGKTIEYEYSPYNHSIDEIVCDLAKQIEQGFTIDYIDYSKAISCKIGGTYKLIIRLCNQNKK